MRIRNSLSSPKVSLSLNSASLVLAAASNSSRRSPNSWGAANEVEYR
jgi:hypothetical protein